MPITSTTTTPTAVALHSSSSKGVGGVGGDSILACGSGPDQIVVTLHKDPQCGASSFGFNVKGGLEFG